MTMRKTNKPRPTRARKGRLPGPISRIEQIRRTNARAPPGTRLVQTEGYAAWVKRKMAQKGRPVRLRPPRPGLIQLDEWKRSQPFLEVLKAGIALAKRPDLSDRQKKELSQFNSAMQQVLRRHYQYQKTEPQRIWDALEPINIGHTPKTQKWAKIILANIATVYNLTQAQNRMPRPPRVPKRPRR